MENDLRIEYVGPFRHHDVVVTGHRVPFLEAALPQGGKVSLVLDRRFGVTLTVAEAEQVVPFLAHTIAVAMGYACHPTEEMDHPVERPPFPRVVGIGEIRSKEAPDGE